MGWVVVAHAINSITQEAEAAGSLRIEASLAYRVSARTARAAQRNLVLRKKKKKKKTAFMIFHLKRLSAQLS